MKSKKILSLLCLVLFVFALTLTVSAANNNAIGFTMESSDSIVSAGETFTVDLKVTENTGFVWAQVSVEYDSAQVSYVENADNADGNAFGVSKDAATLAVRNRDSQKDILVTVGHQSSAFTPAGAKVYGQTGKVVTLTFKVNEGYDGPVNLKLTWNQNNVINSANEKNFAISGNTLALTAVDWSDHTHTEKILPGKEATCTATGLTEGKQCMVCNKIYVAQETIPAKGHLNDVKLNAVPATCVATGLTEGTKCSRCGTVTKAQETVPLAAHVMGAWSQSKAPGCETKGEETRACTVSGCTHKETREVAALGHLNDVKLNAVPATCVATGLTEGTKCSRCGTVTKAQETVPLAAHVMGNWSQTKAPGCETKGQETRTCTVSGCSHKETRDVAATGHKMGEFAVTMAPTCTEKGSSTSECLNGCGKTEKKEVPALGHDWNKTKGTAATCSAEGKKDLWVCKTCNATDTENNGGAIAKLAHTPGVIPGKAATCTATGLTDGSKCLVCFVEIKAQEVIPVKDHKLSDTYENSNADKHWKECVDCGYKANEAAHTIKNGVCSVCGYGCPHKGGKATCSSKATCALCGMKYGSTLAHTPGDAATCETDQTCKVCNAVIVKAAGHSFVDHAEKAPTCTDAGNKAYQTCANCDYTSYEEIAATGHKLEDHAAQAATCGAIGWDAYQTCANCDYTTYQEIAATGVHTYDNDCDADCNDCGATRTPADHKYGQWETVKEATTKEEGEKKHTCSVCGHSETEKIPTVEPDGPAWWAILIIALCVGGIAAIVFVLLKKKKN